jgi:outer membrane lipoprotein-sorting protein
MSVAIFGKRSGLAALAAFTPSAARAPRAAGPLAAAALLLGLAGSVSGQDSPTLERMRDRISMGQIYHARFESVYFDSFTLDSSVVQGTLWLGEEGYRVETDQQTLVVSGSVSRVWDADRNRVILSDYREEEDDFAPSVVLSDQDDDMQARDVRIAGGVAVELVSKDPYANLREIRLEVRNGDLPYRATSVDPAENRTVTRLIGSAWLMPGAPGGKAVPSGLFSLEIPPGAEVVDLRETPAAGP